LQLYDDFKTSYLFLVFAEMGPAFLELDQRAELCQWLNRIEKVAISPEKQYPGIGFSKLRSEGALRILFEALGWMAGQMRAAAGAEK